MTDKPAKKARGPSKPKELLSKAKRLRLAFEALGTKKHADEVKAAIDLLDRNRHAPGPFDWYKPKTNEKEAAKALVSAIRRVENLLTYKEQTKAGGQLDKMTRGQDLRGFLAALKEWRERAEGFAKFDVGKPRPSARTARLAVHLAADLMRLHHIPLTLSRRGPFHLLAQAIHGYEIDLLNHCRAEAKTGPNLLVK